MLTIAVSGRIAGTPRVITSMKDGGKVLGVSVAYATVNEKDENGNYIKDENGYNQSHGLYADFKLFDKSGNYEKALRKGQAVSFNARVSRNSWASIDENGQATKNYSQDLVIDTASFEFIGKAPAQA